MQDCRSTPPTSQTGMSHLDFLPSSKSRDTNTRRDIKNPAGTNLDIFLYLVQESAVICQLPLKMAEKTDLGNRRISNFQRHVTLTFDRAIWHTVVHHSLTSTYLPNFIQI